MLQRLEVPIPTQTQTKDETEEIQAVLSSEDFSEFSQPDQTLKVFV